MGRRLEETAQLSEPVDEQIPRSSQIKAEKKKKKKKKHKQPSIASDEVVEIEGKKKNEDQIIEKETEANRKRKLEETPTVTEAKKKMKKEKKEKKERKEKDGKEEGLKGEDDGESKEGCVVVTGKDAKESKYSAFKSFDESKLPDDVLQCCRNFSKPSPIQSHAWPFLLDGRDFIGIAATGSGKTLAFGVPAMMNVLSKRKWNSKTTKGVNPLCLVLSPTRELAQQISDVLCEAGKHCGVKSVCLYGGTSKGPQISSLKSGVDIVIGTPGRLKDLIEMGVCCLAEVSFVVLDEADRMLDMGFEPEVRSILSKTCPARQMVMFSATWPLLVHQLAQEFMDPNPVKVVIGSEDLAANHDVMQIVEVLDDRSRDERLLTLLGKYHKSQRNRVLVFVLYKKEAARVETMLQRRGWNVVSIHGDKAQQARTAALSLFKEGSCPLMIATDVAARGLDIPDVEVVINYSFPLTTEDYVHRIGRTGRAGKKGVAHTFFMQENKGLAGELVNVLKEAGQIVPSDLLKFGTHVKKKANEIVKGDVKVCAQCSSPIRHAFGTLCLVVVTTILSESKLYGAHFREIAADAPKSKKITFDDSD